MPLSTLFGAAAAAGVGNQVWSYNRENYFFDVPLKQSAFFQQQNIQLARYGLFREDVRDATAITTERQTTLLVSNTLQLGFSITLFYNVVFFPPTWTNYHFQFDQLFITSLLTAMFWLMSSIWFSIYSLIISSSLMTKMLLQITRLPLPSFQDICSSVPGSADFERNLGTAFRLPFLQRRGFGSEQDVPTSDRPSAAREPSRDASGRLANGDSPGRLGKLLGNSPSDAEEAGQALGQEPLNIVDILEDTDRLRNAPQPEDLSKLEAHQKLIQLARSNYTPYDFYSYVSMVLGSSALISSLGEIAISYLRYKDDPDHPSLSGKTAYAVMTVMSWWTVVINLEVGLVGHVVIAILMLQGLVYSMWKGHFHEGNDMNWTDQETSFCFVAQAAWCIALAWSALFPWNKWPAAWRYQHYMNVLHKESTPGYDIEHDLVVRGGAIKMRDYSVHPTWKHMPAHSDESSDDLSDTEGNHGLSWQAAYLGAAPLLICFSILLKQDLGKKEKKRVEDVRDELLEQGKAAGALEAGMQIATITDPFQVALENGVRLWVNLHTESFPEQISHAESRKDYEVSLQELLTHAQQVAKILGKAALTWNEQDVRNLRGHGGFSVYGIHSLISNFLPRGHSRLNSMGRFARNQFLICCLFVTLGWVGTCISTFTVEGSPDHLKPAFLTRRLVTLDGDLLAEPVEFALQKKPWLEFQALRCSVDGASLVLGSSAGSHIVDSNGSSFLGPFHPCHDLDVMSSETFAADFGPDGDVWVACPDGLHQMAWNSSVIQPPKLGLAAKSGTLRALALDALPPTGGSVAGLALLGNHLVAVDKGKSGEWLFSGRAQPPALKQGSSLLALALRAGQGLALDSKRFVHHWDAYTGRWSSVTHQLPAGFMWKDICMMPDGGWLALGEAEQFSDSEPGARFRFWHFSIAEPSTLWEKEM